MLVRVDDEFFGPFLPGDEGRYFVLGFGANDILTVSGNLDIDAVLIGDEGRDYLAGGRGDDTLFGGDGNDTMLGGEGDNTYFGDAGNDDLFGRDGIDLMFGGRGNDSLTSGGGNDVLYGEAGNDQLAGGEDDDILQGGTGNDILDGYYGNDVLVGGDGIDELSGHHGNDLLIGGGDRDKLRGNRGDDILIASETIYDNDDDDLIDILSVWNTAAPIDVRIVNLSSGSNPLVSGSVLDDGEAEAPVGGANADYFLLSAGDAANDFDPLVDRMTNV